MPKEEKKKRLLFSNLKLVPSPFLIPFTCRTFSEPLVSMTMSLYWSQGTSEKLECVTMETRCSERDLYYDWIRLRYSLAQIQMYSVASDL